VPIVFFAFRIMVGCGLVLLGLALAGAWLRLRGRLYDTAWFSFLCAFSSPLGFIAILAGWTVTEAGRQPWIVYGQLRTAQAATALPAYTVAASFALFALIYAVLLGAFFYYAGRLVLAGPDARSEGAGLAVHPGADSAPAHPRGG
jgi:cytochrome d ubiquinol oxidase subunit I